MLVNSNKGEKILENIKFELEVKETDLSRAIKYNKSINQPAFYNKNREEFFSKINDINIIENIENNLYDKE